MKKCLTVIMLVSLLLTAGSVFAETYSYPVERPIFSIDFPKEWKVQFNTEEVAILATSPDENIEYYIWPLPAKDVKADVKAALKSAVNEVKETVQEYVANPNFGDWHNETINGIDFVWAEGTGKEKESGQDISMGVDFFSPDGETIYVLTYWGTPEADAKYKKDLDIIDHSIKKAGAAAPAATAPAAPPSAPAATAPAAAPAAPAETAPPAAAPSQNPATK